MEYKHGPQFTKAVEGREVSGVFAVHGNVDDGNDRSHPGAFGAFMAGRRRRVRYLWQHDGSAPPIATILEIRDIGREELPPAVLDFAPEATGGTLVRRRYLDTPRGNEVLEGIKSGAIEEMSYAYDVLRYDIERGDEKAGPVRNLYEMALFDISDVNWGLNPATLAAKRLPLADQGDAVIRTVAEYTDRLKALSELRAKEGRVLSGANRTRIEAAIEALNGALEALNTLLAASEPQKSGPQLFAEFQRIVAQLNGV